MTTYTDEELLEMDGIVRDEEGRIRFKTIAYDPNGRSDLYE